MPKIEPFEKYTEEYEAWFKQNAEIYGVELEALRQLLPPGPFDGLEVGVGSGRFAAPLGFTLGVEPSERMAALAEARGIRVLRGVAESLPVEDASVDVVLMVTVICFVDDIRRAFAEAYRVLRPGGVVIVGFVDKESELGKSYEAQRKGSHFYEDATFYATSEVAGSLADAGFCSLESRQALIFGEPLEVIRAGHGEGAFIALRAVKPG